MLLDIVEKSCAVINVLRNELIEEGRLRLAGEARLPLQEPPLPPQ